MKQVFNMSDKVYDTLKWVCLIFLPALSIAYSAFASTWNLPFGEEIPITLSILEVFLGSLLGVSTAEYRKRNAVENVTDVLPEAGETNGD